MLYKYSGLTQEQIGELLGGVDYGAVYQLRYRMKERLTQDNALQLQYRNIEQTIRENVECWQADRECRNSTFRHL